MLFYDNGDIFHSYPGIDVFTLSGYNANVLPNLNVYSNDGAGPDRETRLYNAQGDIIWEVGINYRMEEKAIGPLVDLFPERSFSWQDGGDITLRHHHDFWPLV